MTLTNEFVAEVLGMPKPRITFAQLQQLLMDMGFTQSFTHR